MKELKHLHELVDNLRSEGEDELANLIEKKAQDLFLLRAKSMSNKEEIKED